MMRHKKFFTKAAAFCMAVTLTCGLFPLGTIESIRAAEETDAQKEEEQPVIEYIVIETTDDFLEFARNCSIDAWSENKWISLKNDINLSGADFTMIPVFAGTFDGMGHTISNFNYTGDGYVTGLFRYIERDGVVQNLKVKGNITAENEEECIGSICGINYGTIKNCTFQGTVDGLDTIGGIVGQNESTGTVAGCSAAGRITGYYATGGIAGKNHGVLINCTNRASINDNTEWVVEDDEMGTGIFLSITTSDDDDSIELYSGVDTGGVAGYSDGLISRCSNYGNVGYEHTGYNIGGVAGRQAGVMSLCTNRGNVYGRKDVGGIVGQMEPYLEIDEAQSLRNAINKLHDLIDKTIDDLQDGKDVLSDDFDRLSDYGDAALDTGDAMAEQMTDFVDENIDQINSLSERMEHIMDMVPDVMDDVDDAGESLKDLGDIVKDLANDLDVLDKIDENASVDTENRITRLSTVGGNITCDKGNPGEGETVTVTVTPEDGYTLDGDVTVADTNGNAVACNSAGDNKYTFTMPSENVRVTAKFTYIGTFLVESNAGGRVSTAKDGDTYTFTISDDNIKDGYVFTKFTVNSTNYTDKTLTLKRSDYFSNSTDDVIVKAVFEKNSTSGTSTTTISNSNEATNEQNSTDSDEQQQNNTSSETSDEQQQTEPSTEVSDETQQTDDSSKAPDEEQQTDTPTEASDNTQSETTPAITANNISTIGGSKTDTAGTKTTNILSVGFNALVDETDLLQNTKTESDNSEKNTEASTEEEFSSEESNTEEESSSEESNAREESSSEEPNTEEESSSEESNTEEESSSEIFEPTKKSPSLRKISSNASSQAANSTEYEISTVTGHGGTVTTSTTETEQGETVYITPIASNKYKVKSVTVNQSNGSSVAVTKENRGNRYSFTMPASDVTVTAEFEPISMRLSSNVSGNASYSGTADTITLRIAPDTSYTVKDRTVKDKNGNRMSLSKVSGSSYEYTFDIGSSSSPYTANITFEEQSRSDSISSAEDSIDDSIDTLQDATDNANNCLNRIEEIMTNDDGSIKEWSTLSKDEQDEVLDEIEDLADYLGEMSDAASSILSDLNVIAKAVAPYIEDAAKAAKKDIDRAVDQVQEALDYLNSASKNVRSIVNYVNDQPEIRFSELGEDFDTNRENLHDQLQGISDCLDALENSASHYSDIVADDLRAVNDQLDIVFNLFADRMTDMTGSTSMEDLYEEVSEDEIDSITTGRVDSCTNKGIVKGDINVGGVAGAMSVDDEDPEDNAAGNVDYELGRRFITKCIISGGVNEGYVTAKKDGAGGIVGYMKHGVVIDSEGYGSVESTDGNYVGGIAGESLSVIKHCYALCSVSGGKNIGGIAGYADTLQDCYAIADCEASIGRKGAIAGQIASFAEILEGTGRDEEENDEENDEDDEDRKNKEDDEEDEESESVEQKVCRNYYVGDDLYGIDNISYVGIAEPITYEELLTVEKLPNEFWHLKVIYRIEDSYLGTQEVKFGASLANLDYPDIPKKDGYYGVWPDYSDRTMAGTLVVEGEYKEDVTVVESREKAVAAETEDGVLEKPYALVEQIFTEDTTLAVTLGGAKPPAEADGKEYMVYNVLLENSSIDADDTFAIRLYNPYGEDATAWGLTNGTWTQLESKERGSYLQVNMTGPEGTFCVMESDASRIMIIIIAAAAAAIVIILLIVLIKKSRARRRKRKGKKTK